MSVFTDIKQQLFRKRIQRAISDRAGRPDRLLIGIEQVGLLFEVGEVDERHEAEAFAQFLKKQGKKVFLLGYLDDQTKETLHFPFNFFKRNDVNWLGIPKGDVIQHFYAKKFDLLVNLSLKKHKPLEYICATVSASVKIGPIPGHSEHSYDVIVDTGSNGTVRDLRNEIWGLVQKLTVRDVKVKV